MDTRSLTCFLAVAGEGNLTRASRELYLSQSAVSSQIRVLEEELGFPLFRRLPRGMELTAEGEALLPSARRAVRGMEDFSAQAAALREAPGRVLAVGLNTDPAFLRMSALVQGMRRLAPGVRLSFRVSESRLTAAMLRQGELDAGFRFGVWNEDGVHDEFLAPVPLGIAVPTSLAGRVAPGDWRGLAALPWIATFRGCPFHVAVRERLSALGAEINAVEQTMDENIMRELVSEGVGVAVLRLGEARVLAESGRAELWPETLQVPLCLSYPAGKGYLAPLREFREVVHAVWAVAAPPPRPRPEAPGPAPRLDSPGLDG